MILACANWIFGYAQRTECLLEEHWKFIKEDVVGAQLVTYDDTKWETVSVPHDWAIYGPFDRNNDLQNVTVVQNLEKKTSLKTGYCYVCIWGAPAVTFSRMLLLSPSHFLIFNLKR